MTYSQHVSCDHKHENIVPILGIPQLTPAHLQSFITMVKLFDQFLISAVQSFNYSNKKTVATAPLEYREHSHGHIIIHKGKMLGCWFPWVYHHIHA